MKKIENDALNIKEFDIIEMKDGRIGTIVHVYNITKYEIEFLKNNNTISVETVDIKEIKNKKI